MLTAVIWTIANYAAAQNYYRSSPIGQQAIGMGGAYTGLADDPSAAYYNPAGLMRRDVNQFSGGLSLVGFDRLQIEFE
jgi:long-chain fatty acid transport protein